MVDHGWIRAFIGWRANWDGVVLGQDGEGTCARKRQQDAGILSPVLSEASSGAL